MISLTKARKVSCYYVFKKLVGNFSQKLLLLLKLLKENFVPLMQSFFKPSHCTHLLEKLVVFQLQILSTSEQVFKWFEYNKRKRRSTVWKLRKCIVSILTFFWTKFLWKQHFWFQKHFLLRVKFSVFHTESSLEFWNCCWLSSAIQQLWTKEGEIALSLFLCCIQNF